METGLTVTTSSPADDAKLKQIIEQSDFYAIYNEIERYFFFPEEPGTYDSLEQALEEILTMYDIYACIESI